jgi:Ca2+-binding RTX toxin-like protein
MSVLTTVDVIVKNIKLGTYDFKVVNDLYDESPEQMLADYADVAFGLANGLSGTEFVKSSFIASITSTATDAYALFNSRPEDDPFYQEKTINLYASIGSILTTGYEILSKVPAPQARAIGVVLGGISAILSNHVAQGEVSAAQQEALDAWQRHQDAIAQLEALQESALGDLQAGAADIFSDFAAKFDPAMEKLDVFQDYSVDAGFGTDLMRNIANDMVKELADKNIFVDGRTPELFDQFAQDLDFLNLLRGDGVNFEAIEAWYGHIAGETLSDMESIVNRYSDKLDLVLENDAFLLDNFASSGDDVILANVSQKFLDGGEGNDTFVLDGLTGHKYIYDKSGNNKVQLNGVLLSNANLIVDSGSDGLSFKDDYGNIYTKSVSANGIDYDLTININGGGSLTIIHWDQSPGLFGISLNGPDGEDEIATPEQSNDVLSVGDGIVGQAYYRGNDGSINEHDQLFIKTYDGRESTVGKKDDLGNSLDQSVFNQKEIYFDAKEFSNTGVNGDLFFDGGDLNDVLIGSNGNNHIYGFGGDDYIEGFGGHNLLVGGQGDDYFIGSDLSNHIYMDDIDSFDAGGGGDDYAEGGEGSDWISGGAGDDVIKGGEGQNRLAGGSGRDRIISGSGDDYVFADGYMLRGDETSIELQSDSSLDKDQYDDYVDAGDGNNQVTGGAGSDIIITGDGDDQIGGDIRDISGLSEGLQDRYVPLPQHMHGEDTIYSGAGDDQVIGGGGDDTIYSGDGADRIWGDDNQITAFTPDGNDIVYAGNGADSVFGGAGSDRIYGESGDDSLSGGEGDDLIEGGSGADKIWGMEGDDRANGGDGDDTIWGRVGNDSLDGGAGADEIQGGEGNDVVSGGDGDDTLFGEAGSDVLYGGSGDDWVQDALNAVSSDQNTLYGDDGEDIVLAGLGEDTLHGGDGDDHVQAGAGNDFLEGGAGSDALLGQEGNDTLSGGSGTDYLFGHSGNDTYQFTAGDGLDLLRDTSGSNKIEFGGGVHRPYVKIQQTEYRTYLSYGVGDTVVMDNNSFLKLSDASLSDGTVLSKGDLQELALEGRERQGRRVSSVMRNGSYLGQKIDQFSWFGGQLIGHNSSSGTLNLSNQSAWSQGVTSLTGPVTYYTDADGNVMSSVVGADGAPQVPSGAVEQHVLWPDGSTTTTDANPVTEDSVLSDPDAENSAPEGAAGDSSGISSDDEVLNGTDSDDVLDGESGNDLIRGYVGNDTLSGGAGNDLLFGAEGNDVLDGGSGDDIVAGGEGDDSIQGNDGVDTLQGDSGDDSINGGSGDDMLTGGAGNDLLDGGAGSDTYYFSPGDGVDTINHQSGINGFDKLRFENGISPDDVEVSRTENDLLLTIGSEGDQVRVVGFFDGDATTFKAIDEVVFSGNDVVWDVDQIKSLVLVGTEFSDTLIGYSSDDTILGMGGDDELSGGSGNDELTGGAGDDALSGGLGNDSYHFDLGDGFDTLNDLGGEQNVISFGEGIDKDSIRLKRVGDDLRIQVDGLDGVLLKYFFSESTANFSNIQFFDGESLTASDLKAMVLIGDDTNEELAGYDTDDLIDGGHGNDTLIGNGGDDVYYFEPGDGSDVIRNGDSDETSVDRIVFADGIAPANVELSRNNDDLVLNYGTSDQLTISDFFVGEGKSAAGIDAAEFSDGTVWSAEHLLAKVLVGSESDEALVGYSSDDVLVGGRGQDTLSGGLGDDAYRFSKGDGADTLYDAGGQDRIEFTDVASSEVVVRREGDHLRITVPSTGDSIFIERQFDGTGTAVQSTSLETVDFSDGVSWTFSDLMDQAVEGTAGDDLIQGFSQGETINGGDGADEIYGHEGADTILGGAGNDELDGGDGEDSLAGGTGDDVLRGGEATDTLQGGDGADMLHGGQDDDVLYGDAGTDELHGGSGNDELAGGADADVLYGDLGSDTLTGGTGDDVLHGGTGDDTLTGDAGDDILYGDGGSDTLTGGEGNDELYGTGQLSGGNGDDVLEGRGTLDGGAGNDQLQGQGSDTLLGGAGNDVLTANTDAWQETSNTLEGGTGADQLFGSYGNDTYRFNLGDGQDTLTETPEGEAYSNIAPSQDTLEFGSDIAAQDLSFVRSGNDLQINHTNGTDGILIKNWFQEPNDHYKVNRFVFADGTEWTDLDVEEASVTVGTEGADTLLGYRNLNEEVFAGEGNDKVWGREGNDVLYGEAGDDYLDGEAGDDHLLGGAGNDNLVGRAGADSLDGGLGGDTLQGGAGQDTLLGGSGEDSLFGGEGDDQINGGADNDFVEAGAGNDVANGGAGDDQINGGLGDDILVGGVGNDRYVFAAGSGHDTVDNSDGGNDGVFLTGGATEDRISFTRDGDDLVLLIDEGAEGSLRVLDHFLGGDNAIDWVQPDGGYMISTTQINQRVAAGETGGDFDSVVTGTSSGEQLVGGSDSNLMQGLAGDDTLFAMGGDDQLEGGAGADQLYGGNGSGSGSGNDTLIGGDGNDTLIGEDGDDSLAGGAGNDSYYYKAGQGVDVIDNTGGGSDGVFFLDGLDRNRLSYHQDGNDLVILVDGDLEQQVRVTDHFLGGENAISYIQPTDGGNAIMASQLGGLLTAMPDEGGSAGGETGGGPEGGDTSGDDGDTGSGTDPGAAPTPELGGDDVLTGGSANDILVGGVGNDTLSGGHGNDRLEGGVGDDTYLFNGGQDVLKETSGADTLRFGAGITFSQVASGLMKSGDDLVLKVNGGPDQVTLTGFFLGGGSVVETVEFETGGQITSDQIFGAFGMSEPTPAASSLEITEGTSGDDSGLAGSADADLVQGFGGDDSLSGGAGNDQLEGGNGHDSLSGGVGSDTLIGGRGNDTYLFSAGDGQDVIDNVGGGNDTLRFEDISFNQVASGLMKSGNDLVLQVGGGSDSVTIQDFFSGGDQSIDQIEFGPGGQLTSSQIFGAFGLNNPDPQGSPEYQGLPDQRGFGNLVNGTASADNILASSDADFVDGGAGDDFLSGGLGDDYLMGGEGNDSYQFASGDGQDTINNLSNGAGDDQLHFASGIDESQLWFFRDGDDLVTSVLGSDDQVRVQDWYSNDAQKLDSIHTDDASITANQLEQLVTAMASFGDPAAGEVTLTPQEENQVQSAIASSWQPS